MKNTQELYACLHVREFAAQALLRLRPELRGKPCVVMEGTPPEETVCSLNTKARLLGIRHGMTRVEVETFNVVMLTRSPATERSTADVLLECAATYSPRIERIHESQDFLCGIDITGTQRLFGPPAILVRDLKARVRSLGISATLVVSNNLLTAICIARGSANKQLQIIPPGEEAVALAPLPISVLDLSEAQAEILSLWGISTLGMLASLPKRDLIARMGQDGGRLHEIAHGSLPHLFQPAQIPFTLEECTELEHPLDNLDSLLFGISTMLEQLILRAQSRALSLASVTVTLQLDVLGSYVRTVYSRVPSSDKKLWLKLLHLDLQTHPPDGGIVGVVLSADAAARGSVQLGLFSPQLPEPERLDVTLAKITSLVGEGNVGRAVLEDTHRPDAFHIDAFRVTANEPAPISPAPPRASLRLLRPPAPSTITLVNGEPQLFYFQNRRYAVEHAHGPWRTSGDWWRADTWDGEQWDLIARAQDGTLLFCCAIHDRLKNAWYITGLYD